MTLLDCLGLAQSRPRGCAGGAAGAIKAAEALQRGDWGIAWIHARAAAAGGADSPDVLAVRGIALARLGCFDDAEACLRNALTQARCWRLVQAGGVVSSVTSVVSYHGHATVIGINHHIQRPCPWTNQMDTLGS